ncbi:MAG: DUF6789 family protein [Haloferacaceae archaeon]
MVDEFTSTGESVVDETALEAEIPITIKVVGSAMVGGLAGMLLMVPVLVGVPIVFDLFRTEPLVNFATFLSYVGFEQSVTLGAALFVATGATVLPLTFVVVGGFLPPKEPRYLRGVTFATIFWTGFVPAFWPDGSVAVVAVFLVVSLLAHWVYGLVLGRVLDGPTGIPQHDV